MDQAALKKDLVSALRSGAFQQHRNAMVDNYHAPKAYCCLGVAAKVAGFTVGSCPYSKINAVFGISEAVGDKLISMNDTKQFSFGKIADWIETHDLASGKYLRKK